MKAKHLYLTRYILRIKHINPNNSTNLFFKNILRIKYGARELRMWTARHIDGSLQSLCHGEHTICALVRISNASSLIRIDAVTSRGRASQLRNSSGGGSIARFSVQGVSDMGNGVRRRKKERFEKKEKKRK
jgi:hypothetical protein